MTPASTRLLSPSATTVACPSCGKERAAEPGRYVCARCGAEFLVEDTNGGASA